MHPNVLLLCAVLATTSGPVAAAPRNGDLIERRAYAPPAYDRSSDLAKLIGADEYRSAVSDARFTCERLVYSSDGLPVVAYLYRPTRPPPRPLPAVIFNRGSYVRGDIGGEMLPMMRRLGAAGFVVIAPLYRGSDGAPGHDEMGGADLHDLMNVVPLAASLAIVDTSRLFLYGESRGGVMVFEALRAGFPALAAAVYGAFTDFDSLVDADRERYDQVIPMIWPEYAKEHAAIAESRSAVRWAEELRSPLLIMQGGADGGLDASHSLRLAERLQRLEREYELVIYGGDGHVLRENHLDRDARAIRWFKRHEAR